MALEGNLRDFSLTDVLHLLQTGGKTGTLHVERDGDHVIVCFKGGEIYHASHGEDLEPISKRLVRAGIVNDKQLRQAQGLMKIQKKDKGERRLGQILVDEGYVDGNVLSDFLRVHFAEVLFDVMRWGNGSIRFEPDEVLLDHDLGIALPVEAVLAEAGKRLEIWERIREKIPSLDTRFVMSGTPAERTTEIHLKPREWMLLCYLHGSRSVRELVELTGYSDFETARLLYGMYANGLIEKVGPAGEPVED